MIYSHSAAASSSTFQWKNQYCTRLSLCCCEYIPQSIYISNIIFFTTLQRLCNVVYEMRVLMGFFFWIKGRETISIYLTPLSGCCDTSNFNKNSHWSISSWIKFHFESIKLELFTTSALQGIRLPRGILFLSAIY